jgi:N-acetylneuraminic acid mutarotase
MRFHFPLLALLGLAACGGTAADPAPPPSDAGPDTADVVVTGPPTATVTPTGSLAEARANHTATLLKDGRVLVVGGEQISTRTPTASIEAWDPKTGKFSTLTPLPKPVVGHTATLLKDGRVLIAGGGKFSANGSPSGEDVTDAAFVFDPTTNEAKPVSPMKHARGQHFAVLLGDGKVLVGGGADAVPSSFPPALDAVELFDPTTGQFTDDTKLVEPREMAQAVALDGQRVMVISGMNTKKGALASSEIYDEKTHAFTAGPTLVDGGRIYHSTLHASDGKVLVLGGVQSTQSGPTFLDSVEVWGGSEFALGALLPKGRNSAPMIEVGGHAVAVGGFSWDGVISTFFDDVLWLGSDGWKVVGNLKYGTFGHTVTPLSDGRLLVVGGSNAKTQARAELVTLQ